MEVDAITPSPHPLISPPSVRTASKEPEALAKEGPSEQPPLQQDRVSVGGGVFSLISAHLWNRKDRVEKAPAEQAPMQEHRATGSDATGSIFAVATCCGSSVLSAISKAADGFSNVDGGRGVMGYGVHGTLNSIFAGVTTYFAGGSAISSGKTAYNYYHKWTEANQVLEDHRLVTNVCGETPESKAIGSVYEFERSTIAHQALLSGATVPTSTLLLVSQYVHPAYPEALFSSSGESAIRALDCGRFIKRARKAVSQIKRKEVLEENTRLPLDPEDRARRINRLEELRQLRLISNTELKKIDPNSNGAPPNDKSLEELTRLSSAEQIYRNHFNEQNGVASKNAFGWATIADGILWVGANSVTENASTTTRKTLLGGGVGQIFLGTGFTYHYHSKLYGPAFSSGIREEYASPIKRAASLIRKKFNRICSENPRIRQDEAFEKIKKEVSAPEFPNIDKVCKELIKSQRMRVISEDYRKELETEPLAKAKAATVGIEALKEAFSIATVQALPDRWYDSLSRRTKEIVSGLLPPDREFVAKRLAFVEQLHPDYDPLHPMKISNLDGPGIISVYEKLFELRYNADCSPKWNPAVGGVANILLRRILEEVPRGGQTLSESVLDNIKVGDTVYRIKPDFHDLFDLDDEAKHKDMVDSMKIVLETAPCCDSGMAGAELFEPLFKHHKVRTDDESKIQVQLCLSNLVQYSIDQYMKYQLPIDSDNKRGFWSNVAYEIGFCGNATGAP
jgi:hypothetical protein